MTQPTFFCCDLEHSNDCSENISGHSLVSLLKSGIQPIPTLCQALGIFLVITSSKQFCVLPQAASILIL